MRSQKFLFTSTTVLASLSIASMSLADTEDPEQASRETRETIPPPAVQPVQPGQPPPTPGVTPMQPVTPTMPPGTTTTTAGTVTPGPITAAGAPPTQETISIYDKRRPNTPLLITGGAMLVGTYATTAGVVASTQRRQDQNLLIPVAGPWLNLSDRRCPGCANEPMNQALIVGSGILQGLGALMIGASFIVPEKVETAKIQAGPVTIHVSPTAGQAGAGIGAFGTF